MTHAISHQLSDLVQHSTPLADAQKHRVPVMDLVLIKLDLPAQQSSKRSAENRP